MAKNGPRSGIDLPMLPAALGLRWNPPNTFHIKKGNNVESSTSHFGRYFSLFNGLYVGTELAKCFDSDRKKEFITGSI